MTDLAYTARRGVFGGVMTGTSADGVDIAFIEFVRQVYALPVPPSPPPSSPTSPPPAPVAPLAAASAFCMACCGTAGGDELLAGGEAGVGAACVPAWRDVSVRLLYHTTLPLPPALRARIFRMRGDGAQCTLADVCDLTAELAAVQGAGIAAAMAAARLAPHHIAAIGVHGQTMYHAPPVTLQLIDPAHIAAVTGVDIVSDFRRADCAAGGQGAPLVPFADHCLFASRAAHRCVINLGGIANLTLLPAGGTIAQLRAFDTGPANCLSDAVLRAPADFSACVEGGEGGGEGEGEQAAACRAGMDAGGRLAAQGAVLWRVVADVLRLPYFAAPPPKSTDIPGLIAAFTRALQEEAHRAPTRSLRLPDVLATACAISACALADGICAAAAAAAAAAGGEGGAPAAWELLFAGGGVHNALLMRLLLDVLTDLGCLPPAVRAGEEVHAPWRARSAAADGAPLADLPMPLSLRTCGGAQPHATPALAQRVRIASARTTDVVGVPSEAREAVAFACLAAATLDRVPNNVPSCTGAQRAVVGGSITPAPCAWA